MPLLIPKPIHFGPFLVTSQVFHITPLSFALVNLKPLLPGHILVSPIRRVPRLSELNHAEVTDLFMTVQRVSRMVERIFNASALNIAIQDGKDAGQSIPHVHCHIIPRHKSDLDHKGGGDKIYEMLDGEEGNVGKHFWERESGGFPKPDADEDRKPRSEEEMLREAEWFAEEMIKDTVSRQSSNNSSS
ncbi:HIT-like protein [Patellaria atrata CBS 101060]|uniref:Bis(5'-adenosyl)-triphosphatase n=1 Tax=Patellaria atrata CBS 101060 TaxID=1346257 RepID=A0A9P4VPY4_9PEZI|nr:HIT-like protein [Patellaria atrata CBS 101060]